MAVIIEIKNLQKAIPLKPHRIYILLQEILKRTGVQEAQLSVVIVTDRKIKALNRDYHRRDEVTDVLAFDLSEGMLSVQHQGLRRAKAKLIEGEVVVSARTAKRQAKEYKTSPEQELVLYLVHGILHLIGFNDHGKLERQKMRREEERIMRDLVRKGEMTLV